MFDPHVQLLHELRGTVRDHVSAIARTQLGLFALCWLTFIYESGFARFEHSALSESCGILTIAALCSQLSALAFHVYFMSSTRGRIGFYFQASALLSLLGGLEAVILPAKIQPLYAFACTVSGLLAGSVSLWCVLQIVCRFFTVRTCRGEPIESDLSDWCVRPQFSIRRLFMLTTIAATWSALFRFRLLLNLDHGSAEQFDALSPSFHSFLSETFFTAGFAALLCSWLWLLYLSPYGYIASTFSAILAAVILVPMCLMVLLFTPLEALCLIPLFTAIGWHFGVVLIVYCNRDLQVSLRRR